MTLLKDDRTLRLDDLDIAASEAEALYEDLERRIDDDALRALVAEHAAAQREALGRVDEIRRARGDLPQAGDPERSHLGAAGAALRALVLPGDPAAHYVESLLDAAAKVSAALDDALAIDLDPDLRRLLTDLKDRNAAFETALRARL